MAFKITKKELENNYSFIIGVGYCELQYLFYLFDRIGYNSTSQWNYDIYSFLNNRNIGFAGTCITTGYSRPSNCFRPSHEVVKMFENQAEKIILNRELSYEEKYSKCEKLIHDFIDNCVTTWRESVTI